MSESPSLNREALFAKSKEVPRVRKVEVPELGGHVCVRVLTAEERDAWERQTFDRKSADGEAELPGQIDPALRR